MRASFVVIVCATLIAGAFAEPVSLDEVFAPVVVGTPPCAAARDLCRTATGEIRHYGGQRVNGKSQGVYVASRDNGLTWKTYVTASNDVGAMVKSPYSGDWIYFREYAKKLCCVRSKVGPGDTNAERTVVGGPSMELRQLIPMKSRKRWVAAFSNVQLKERAPGGTKCYHADVLYSDDDGRTWTTVELPTVPNVERMAPGDKRPHWFNDGCEPAVTELKDGTLLLAARTSGPHAAFCRSRDGGATWSKWEIDTRFWQANTMPYFFRLSDGRLLFIWNNTQMLPTRAIEETPEIFGGERTGEWEVFFSNRDALHAAISDDDGKTWKGFRELALTGIRNRPDFRELGVEYDKSVHQTQALELPGGKVLLAYGQSAPARRLLIFDPNWLLETTRYDEFRLGLDNVSHHLYLKSHAGGIRGWTGHCACNRIPGAVMIRNPDLPDTIHGEVLHLARVPDPRLLCDRQGVVWNFPASDKGTVKVDCQIAGEGFRLTLADRWINPCDETNPGRAPFSLPVTPKMLSGGASGWHLLTVSWDAAAGVVKVFDEQDKTRRPIAEARLAYRPAGGISYLHLQALADRADLKGTFFRSFSKE